MKNDVNIVILNTHNVDVNRSAGTTRKSRIAHSPKNIPINTIIAGIIKWIDNDVLKTLDNSFSSPFQIPKAKNLESPLEITVFKNTTINNIEPIKLYKP